MNTPNKEEIKEIKEKNAKAKHMGKPPGAKNVTIMYDADGHWLCEIYKARIEIDDD